MTDRPLKVFLSYKWESEEHNRWVEKLATDLREFGIESILDKWSVRYGDSFTDYMTSMIGKADVVLFIMTKKSVEAVESTFHGGAVKFEMQLSISRKIAGENLRVIGVYREGPKVAAHLRDHRYADFRDDSKFEESLVDLIKDLKGKKFVPSVKLANNFATQHLDKKFFEPVKLSDPFGFLNASDIYSPFLLKTMFSSALPVFRTIENPDQPCIIISGPRGCGKTLIFRNMQFINQFDRNAPDLNHMLGKINYVGLYISCKTSFRNYLITNAGQKWLSDPRRIRFYFNILATFELLDVLSTLLESKIENQGKIQIIIKFISKTFGTSASHCSECKSELHSLIRGIFSGNTKQPQNINDFNSSADFLNQISQLIQINLSSISSKKLFLLVDDFNWNWMHSLIITEISKILFGISPQYNVRISAICNPFFLGSGIVAEYVLNRDYIEINLGQEYIELSNDYRACTGFFNDIIRRRYQLAQRSNFIGIERLLGKDDESSNIGVRIRELAENNKLRMLRYYGANLLIQLCSGDISYIIEILDKMTASTRDDKYPISRTIQHRVIRNYSINQLNLLRSVETKYVSSLYEIAYYFGIMSKNMLIKRGMEFLRMDVEVDDLSTDQLRAIMELISYGVFLDAGYSPNSFGVMTRKLVFRRIYSPAFPTTFINRNTFAFDAKRFGDFIYNPKQFSRKILET